MLRGDDAHKSLERGMGTTSARLVRSVLRPRTMRFQSRTFWAIMGETAPAEGGAGGGVYLRTISFHLWKTSSTMWSFQLTAIRKAISFWLISWVLSPEILLQARAE